MNTIQNQAYSIASLIAHVVSECTAIDQEKRFDEMLDECYSFEKVGGPFESMVPSQVLKECDPTAYRCGVNDWADGEDWNEIEGDYYESSDVDKARDEYVDELNSELSSLQDQLENEESEDERDESEIARLGAEIVNLETFIAECERYAF